MHVQRHEKKTIRRAPGHALIATTALYSKHISQNHTRPLGNVQRVLFNTTPCRHQRQHSKRPSTLLLPLRRHSASHQSTGFLPQAIFETHLLLSVGDIGSLAFRVALFIGLTTLKTRQTTTNSKKNERIIKNTPKSNRRLSPTRYSRANVSGSQHHVARRYQVQVHGNSSAR